MSKQIVVSGNRVLAHGENCFTAYGGKVICMEKERTYENATVVNVETIPADIDDVGYEYHAGVFVPCAPYGKGMGNLAVVCNDDCKSIKDGGLPLSTFYNGGLPVPARIVYGTYTGTSAHGRNNPNILTFDFAPLLVCVFTQPTDAANHLFWAGEMQLVMCRGIEEQAWCKDPLGNPTWTQAARKIRWDDNSVTWYANLATGVGGGAEVQWNTSGKIYHYVAIG